MASAETAPVAGDTEEAALGEPETYVEGRLTAARRLEAEAQQSSEDSTPPTAAGTTEPDEDSASALRAVELRLRRAKVANEEQDLKLRRLVAQWSIGFVCVQLVAANLFFGWYLWFNRVSPDARVMAVWLASSVIEVIGIVAVIARSLFPGKRRRKRLHPKA